MTVSECQLLDIARAKTDIAIYSENDDYQKHIPTTFSAPALSGRGTICQMKKIPPWTNLHIAVSSCLAWQTVSITIL